MHLHIFQCTTYVDFKGSTTKMKSQRLSLKSEILSCQGYSVYLHKFMEITITYLTILAITCLKSQRNLEILLKSLKSWRRFSSVTDPSVDFLYKRFWAYGYIQKFYKYFLAVQ